MTAVSLVAQGDWREAQWRLRRNLHLVSDQEIVARTWDCRDTTAVRHFWQLPQISARWNAMITGDPGKTYFQYVAEELLSGLHDATVLSICCGTGDWEREWAQWCTFKRLEGIDLSPHRLEIAKAKAAAAGFADWRYTVADANEIKLPAESYDLVLAKAALHHIVNLEHLSAEIKKALRPHGLFIVLDFVGPTRFQWTNRQLSVVNGVLEILPPEYKYLISNPGSLKQRVARPDIKWMIQIDPSEAVRSEEIPALLRHYFTIMEWKALGGGAVTPLTSRYCGKLYREQGGWRSSVGIVLSGRGYANGYRGSTKRLYLCSVS